MSETADYGSWKSPIDSKLAASSDKIIVDGLLSDDTSSVFWVETRPEEDGRAVVCSWNPNHATVRNWTPQGYDVGTAVHEYGGGSLLVRNDHIYFSNLKDNRLYRQLGPDIMPEAITPVNEKWRFADGAYLSGLDKLVYVREDHSTTSMPEDKREEPKNTVVIIDTKTRTVGELIGGCDFYSTPRVTSDLKLICWIQWNHPNMPWESTELCVAELITPRCVISHGSRKIVTSGYGIMLPQWMSNGYLSYITDESDWWNLTCWDPNSNSPPAPIHRVEEDCGWPAWVFGRKPYSFNPEDFGQIAIVHGTDLAILERSSGTVRKIETGYSSALGRPCFTNDGSLYEIVGGPNQDTSILRICSSTLQTRVIYKFVDYNLDPGYLSVPQKISFPTGNNQEVAHGYFYEPKNKDHIPTEDTLPPLLVTVHPGPTLAAHNFLSLQKQYFTSRGFAMLDVDHRGSSGYGRRFRNTLDLSWGIKDIEDIRNGVTYLIKEKLVDENSICIEGCSAGGFSTLTSLTFSDVFKAGVSHFGIPDLLRLVQETHKFESHYIYSMVAPHSESMRPFKERSAFYNLDRFNKPIAFFQGSDDAIVPMKQVQVMFDAVKSKGLPCALTVFPGEKHGFRDPNNVRKSIGGEFYFLAKILGFKKPDVDDEIEIFNLPQ